MGKAMFLKRTIRGIDPTAEVLIDSTPINTTKKNFPGVQMEERNEREY